MSAAPERLGLNARREQRTEAVTGGPLAELASGAADEHTPAKVRCWDATCLCQGPCYSHEGRIKERVPSDKRQTLAGSLLLSLLTGQAQSKRNCTGGTYERCFALLKPAFPPEMRFQKFTYENVLTMG